MANKKNNHYVPQFHLRQWSENSKTIMTFNIPKEIYVKEASIKHQASKNYLYGYDVNFENTLSSIESYAGIVYQKIIQNKTLLCLNEEEMDFLYLYINLCNERSNSRAEEQSYILTETMKVRLLMQKAHNSPDTKYITNDQIENLKLTYNNPNLLSVQTILKYYPITYDLNCVLLKNNSEHEFLTSDYPTIVYNLFSNKHNLFSGWGMSSGGIIYILPINPKLAIMLYDSFAYDCKINNSVIEIKNKNDIKEINKLTMLNSEYCVYGSTNIPINYLINLKKHLNFKSTPPINILGDCKDDTLILVNRKRLRYLANFTFLKIRSEFEKIPVPQHAAGIIRPQSEKIMKELDIYWEQKEKEFLNNNIK